MTTHRKTTEATKDDWRTPRRVFQAWNSRFWFDVDCAADRDNALCAGFMAKQPSPDEGYEGNALLDTWRPGKSFWMNPPFSEAAKFARVAIRNAELARAVVVLVPSATDTRYWMSLANSATEVWMSRGRIKFVNPDTGKQQGANPIGSTIFVLRGRPARDPFLGFFDAVTGRPCGKFGKAAFGELELEVQ
jgi:phage N-6-adenine-methyltransferase